MVVVDGTVVVVVDGMLVDTDGVVVVVVLGGDMRLSMFVIVWALGFWIDAPGGKKATVMS